ncbi:MAG TPA: GMC family oxidoreductase N-terminal domain-containing protein [Sporichthyaceae bacterium]|jgi:choline dehydrogenase|nr:GMC family oxidoreductase N-terminal domain-containing protein [Sporichthyaceae bacterium]
MSVHQPTSEVLIVGGGSAGAVLAARLSENPGREVLLLEAGKAYAAGEFPAGLLQASRVADPEHDWGYVSRGNARNPQMPTPRGKVLGGSSAVNAAVALRARPADFARWADYGIAGWSYEEVLPTYCLMENTPAGDDHFHGRAGPLSIRQRTDAELTPSLLGFVDAAVSSGFKRISDFNGAEQNGAGGYPVDIVDGVRQNTALAYLTPEVRARANLTIVGNVDVDRVLIERATAVGVVADDGTAYRAHEVVLCGGTYGSPAILLRSGIGPPGDLAALGIDVLADLPVGERLHDHPGYYNAYALAPDSVAMTPAVGSLLWTASSEAMGDELDLHVTATHLMDGSYSPTGGAIVLAAALVQPESRGTVKLASCDPRDAPIIDNNFLATDRDTRRMVEAVRLGRTIARDPAFARCTAGEMLPGDSVDDDALPEVVAGNLAIYGHPTSTAPMGGPDDPHAVVDTVGRVRGVDGLRIVDASIMPAVPSATTNLTVIMLAERIFHWVYDR